MSDTIEDLHAKYERIRREADAAKLSFELKKANKAAEDWFLAKPQAPEDQCDAWKAVLLQRLLTEDFHRADAESRACSATSSRQGSQSLPSNVTGISTMGFFPGTSCAGARPKSPSKSELATLAVATRAKGKKTDSASSWLSSFITSSKERARDPRGLLPVVGSLLATQSAVRAKFLAGHVDSLQRISEALGHLESVPPTNSLEDEVAHLRETVLKVRESIALYLCMLDSSLDAPHPTEQGMRRRMQAHVSLFNALDRMNPEALAKPLSSYYDSETSNPPPVAPAIGPKAANSVILDVYCSRGSK